MAVLLGMGTSTAADVMMAGQEAAREMISTLGGRPHLTFVFSAVRFADPRLLKAIRSITEGAPLIGCTSAGNISASGPLPQSVIVIGLRGANAGFVTGVARRVSKDPEAAGRHLAQDLKAGEPSLIKAAVIFPDGLGANGSALLRGVHQGLDASVPIVGSSAGDDFYFQKTFQYFDEEVLTDSLPGVLFCGDVAVGIGVRHGWLPLGLPRQITKAHGGVLYELDGRPAVSIYESYFGAQRRALKKSPFAPMALSYPLGLTGEAGCECLLRCAFQVGDRGALICNGELPEGRWVRLMIGGYEGALTAAREAARHAAHAIGRNRFKGALVFSGGGRQKMLGSEYHGEIDVIRESLGGVGIRLGGFYGYAEQAPVQASNIFHNESVVVMALG